MAASNGKILRLSAPRPLFMSEKERQEYEEIWQFLRERREQNTADMKVYCRFFNMSNRDIDAIWCREEVQNDHIYATIPPRRYFEICTFEGHPWIFRASEDGERMRIIRSDSRIHFPCRTPSKIVETKDGPLKMQGVGIISQDAEDSTLKHLTIKQISQLYSTDFVSKLEIPSSLLVEILEYYINKISYTHALNPSEEAAPEKEPAAKTVDYLKKLLEDLESQHCDLDLREKLRDNMRLFTTIIKDLEATHLNEEDGPSTSKASTSETSRKRALNEASSVDPSSSQSDSQDISAAKKPSKPS
ncbi:hypothetical protein M3Y97_00173300 [Aphelenchoides bicaudatus]|nr:hypothetical protein M3Y97_00173300 [Aphelenchoides bicaudatus]